MARIRCGGAVAAALLLLACTSSARAGLISYTAIPYTGDPARATVTFDDTANPGAVKVTVAVDPSVSIADINGFFLNVRDESLIPGLWVSGDMTLSVKKANGVTSAGPGNNINGEGVGPFDVGLRIGSPGIGKDDYQTATFVLHYSGLSLTNDMFTDAVTEDGDIFAVRLTSVGAPGCNRNGSSKLRNGGDVVTASAVPEPSTLSGLVLLSTLGLLARRVRRESRA
jgi:hypothetical protein